MLMPSPRRCLFALCLALAIAVLTGCANYRLGPGNQAPFRTLFIDSVADNARVPQSRALLDTRLREAFIRDGRTSLEASPSTAEATLTVSISDYRREVAAVRENDTGLARKFNVQVTLSCGLRDNRSGRMIWEGRTISVTREVFTDSGQLQAEYQTLPLLAEAAAAKVVHAALDVW